MMTRNVNMVISRTKSAKLISIYKISEEETIHEIWTKLYLDDKIFEFEIEEKFRVLFSFIIMLTSWSMKWSKTPFVKNSMPPKKDEKKNEEDLEWLEWICLDDLFGNVLPIQTLMPICCIWYESYHMIFFDIARTDKISIYLINYDK